MEDQVKTFAVSALEAVQDAVTVEQVFEAVSYLLSRQETYAYHDTVGVVITAAATSLTALTLDAPTGHPLSMPYRVGSLRDYWPTLGKLPDDVLAQLVDFLDAVEAATTKP